jgi:transcriptional regulator with XRE-family HTH domain
MDLGLTQIQLAERLGCLLASVSQWERGRSEPHPTRWPAIEALLGPGLVPERDGLPGKILAARLRLGMTQEGLARLAGVDVRTVRNAESGRHSPNRQTLRRLKDAIDP